MTTCSAFQCKNAILAKGLCPAHYRRQRLYGDPLRGGSLRTSPGALLDWLHGHVAYDGDGCLVWPFSRSKNGYGQINYADKHTGPHRVMCTLAHGQPQTPKHEAAHSCGNGAGGCVNPQHLYWSTKSQNELDKRAHGTDSRGERNGQARLTTEQALEIAALQGQLSQRAIAKRYGIVRSTVARIHRKQSWLVLIQSAEEAMAG